VAHSGFLTERTRDLLGAVCRAIGPVYLVDVLYFGTSTIAAMVSVPVYV